MLKKKFLGLKKNRGNLSKSLLKVVSLAFLSSGAILFLGGGRIAFAAEARGFIPAFPLVFDDLKLERPAQPFSPFDKVGRRFAFIGTESGSFEAWAYPLKLVRNFELSFLLPTSTQPIQGRDIVRRVLVTPAATLLTFSFQSFTVEAIYVAAIDEPGGLILLDVSSDEPLTIVTRFLPVLQPMWPAGIGGQYAYWDKDLRAYLITEPTRRNHGYVGSPAAEGISYTPAHMLADTPSEFLIRIEHPAEARDKFIPIILAGGKGKREEIKKVYEELASRPEQVYRRAVEHYRNLRMETLGVKTPVTELNLALEWAKVSLDNLFVANPDLGYGMVAGLGPSGSGGRPGFGWFFGGDAFINVLSLNSLGATEAAQAALAFTRKWQRADGKMAHELSQAAGYIDWFKDYPYAYIHGDTTPYYLAAVADYYQRTGDIAFLRESWPSLVRAFEWCLSTDGDGDGLMDNRQAGLGALEYGALTGIQTDIYLAAVWLEACEAMEKMALIMGDRAWAKKAAEMRERGAASWEKFWEDTLDSYVYAFNAQGERVKELTPWPSVGIMWGRGEVSRREKTLEKIFSSEMSTDWGVRVLSTRSSLYEPLNYNYGAVWPFITGFVSTAAFSHNYLPQAFYLLMSGARHFFDNAAGHVTEVFSGSRYIWPQEAVSHQGFSATGFVLPLVRGLCGLEVILPEKLIIFAPKFPADWDEVSLEKVRCGPEIYSFHYLRKDAQVKLAVRREEGKRAENTGRHVPSSGRSTLELRRGEPSPLVSQEFRLRFRPVFGPGVKVKEVRVNGKTWEFKPQNTPRSSQVELEIPLDDDLSLELDLEETAEVRPPLPQSRVGEEDRGLKILSLERRAKEIYLLVEGRKASSYCLGLWRPEYVAAVEGATLVPEGLEIKFPSGGDGGFLKKEIILKLK